MYIKYLKNINHYGDICAIPFFLLLIVYFYKKQNKTRMELLLLYFSIAGFILDTLFSIQFLNSL